MDYILLMLAILFFSLQFIFLKAYQRKTDGGMLASLLFSGIAGISISVIFFCTNGFQLSFTWISLLFAVAMSLLSIFSSVLSR